MHGTDSVLSIEFRGTRKAFLNLKSSTIFCFCYTFKETEQVRATELSIFKQGPRKCALHSAALGAAIYSPRVSCLDLTEGSGMEAGNLSATRAEAACPFAPQLTQNKNPRS